jgi:integrase
MRAPGRFNVRQIAALNTPGVYSDGGGLYVRVRTTGTRSWLFICTVRGKRREMGLGSLYDVTSAQAREKAAAARASFRAGGDPIAERVAAKQSPVEAVTFGAFAESLLDDIESGFRNEKHRKQWRSTLATHAAGIANKAVADVDTADVIALLKPIWSKLPETAARVRGRVERVLDAAKAKGLREGENPARWRGHLDLLLPRRAKAAPVHHAALPFAELPHFMQALTARPAPAARALAFTILTAARSGETLGARWSEINLDEAVWTVPAERMKAGAEHQVPLSAAALALLDAIRPASAQPDDLVFRGSRGGLSSMAMSMLLRRMGQEAVTVHGFRSTFRDWAGETTGFGSEEVEMALAHTIASKTERAYRRGRALEKRRELMAAWASFLSPKRP